MNHLESKFKNYNKFKGRQEDQLLNLKIRLYWKKMMTMMSVGMMMTTFGMNLMMRTTMMTKTNGLKKIGTSM